MINLKKKDIASIGVLVIILFALLALIVVTELGTMEEEEADANHHRIVEVPTPREDVVCYAILDNFKRPTDISCVYIGGNGHAFTDSGSEGSRGVQPGGIAVF